MCFKEIAETGFNTFIKNNFNLFIIDKTRSYLLEYRRAALETFLSTVIWVKKLSFPNNSVPTSSPGRFSLALVGGEVDSVRDARER